ncbi:hypothetical protein O3M35_011027 [Rhynocoris fuscipes]|uniref:Uncharacterized protein n=1 Tax=Rhynocoris fuscipes TaxID=488301 RepID=A0AAW1CUA9_9HEMI
MDSKKLKNPFGNCEECNKKNFSYKEYETKELSEEEREVIKWKRRWALEDMKEKTRDTAHPYHKFYQTLYEKLEQLHLVVDPETKDYLLEQEIKSKHPPKPSEVLLKPEKVNIKPLSGKSRSFSLEKVFKSDEELEKMKSQGLTPFKYNLTDRTDEGGVQGKSIESAYKEYFEKILPKFEEIKHDRKAFEEFKIEYLTKGPLVDDYNKTLSEAETYLKESEKLIEKINERRKLKKNK